MNLAFRTNHLPYATSPPVSVLAPMFSIYLIIRYQVGGGARRFKIAFIISLREGKGWLQK